MDREDGTLAVSGRVLIIAGSDSSGGAGIARDVQTVTMFGLKVAIAVTAVTAQSDRRVTAVQAMDPALVAAQMEAALEGGDIRAVKIGMLANAGIVAAVAAVLERHAGLPVVLDPVLASTSGKALLEPEGIRLMIERLLPRADLTTPNLPELVMLTGMQEMEAAMQRLLSRGARAALVKGGHAKPSHTDMCSDLLIRSGLPPLRFEAPRHPGTLRGTGCMLASAIACGLANDRPLEASIRVAKGHVTHAFREAQRKERAIIPATRSTAD